MPKTSSKFAIWIFSALTVVLLALSMLALFYIKSQSEAAANLSAQADAAGKEEALIQSIRLIQENNKDDLAAFQNFILTDDRLVPLIESIERSGRSLGLKVQIASVDKLPGKSAGDPQKVSLVVESDGSWQGSYAFLKALESLPNRVMIDQVNLSKDSGAWHLKASISLYSFN